MLRFDTTPETTPAGNYLGTNQTAPASERHALPHRHAEPDPGAAAVAAAMGLPVDPAPEQEFGIVDVDAAPEDERRPHQLDPLPANELGAIDIQVDPADAACDVSCGCDMKQEEPMDMPPPAEDLSDPA